jgi:DNA-binding transcriptional LysR family regulator
LAGLGIRFLPGIAVRDAIAQRQLVRLAIRQFSLNRTYVWLERPVAQRSNAIRAFECVLKHAVRGSLPPAPRASAE